MARSMQEQTLTTDQIREFVIAGHGNLNKVKQMLTENPELLNLSYQWNENDRETAIQAAAQVGNSAIAQYLLEKGAPLAICTIAMLGREADLKKLLDEKSDKIRDVGAHSIPLLPHSVWSANLELVKMVYNRGATSGADLAFHNALSRGSYEIVKWLLENAGSNASSKNYQGKTALAIAKETNDARMVLLLKDHGAKE